MRNLAGRRLSGAGLAADLHLPLGLGKPRPNDITPGVRWGELWKSWRVSERVSAVCLFLVLFIDFTRFFKSIFGLLYLGLAAAAAMLAHHGRFRRARVVPAMWCFLGWAIASYAWSIDRHITQFHIRRSLFACFAVWVCASILDREAVQRIFGLVLKIFGVWTVAMLIVQPGKATEPPSFDRGAIGWHGPFVHKNALGQFAVLLITYAITRRIRRERGAEAWLAVGVVLVLGSRSITALMASLIVAMGAWWILTIRRLLDRRQRVLFGTSVVAAMVTVVLLVLTSAAKILGAFGKDLTFSSRDVIWSSVWHSIKMSPLRGFGFGQLYYSNSGVIVDLQRRVGFDIGSSHQGFLDISLQLGVVGSVIMAWWLFSLARVGRDGLKLGVSRSDFASAAWVVLGVIAILANSISEATLSDETLPRLVMIGAVGFGLAGDGRRSGRRRRRRPTKGRTPKAEAAVPMMRS
jgi:exopolysaccharide production protein ExoQ